MSVYGSIQHTDRNSYYGAQKDMNAYGKTNDLTWVVGGMYVGNMDRCLFAPATFTGGVEYQSNSLHDVMTGYHRDMQQDVRIAGGFVQNEWRLNRWTMLVGARLDKHNLIDHPIFSPRVNFLYKPSDNLQARLTYSTGFRAPQAYDEDLHVTAVGVKEYRSGWPTDFVKSAPTVSAVRWIGRSRWGTGSQTFFSKGFIRIYIMYLCSKISVRTKRR